MTFSFEKYKICLTGNFFFYSRFLKIDPTFKIFFPYGLKNQTYFPRQIQIGVWGQFKEGVEN